MKLFSFWSGKQLGFIELLCLRSMLASGAEVDVYSYDRDLILPHGVTLRDAETVLPKSAVVPADFKRLALVSDIFRYAGLKKGAGTWIDLDMLVLRPLDDLPPLIYGWQDPNVINGAILRLPADSSCLEELAALSRQTVFVAPQWTKRQKAIQTVRGLVGRQRAMSELEWGVLGPFALTALLKKHRLLHYSQAYDVFYPVQFERAESYFDPDASSVVRSISSSTRGVHLWNDLIKHLKNAPPPPSSFIGQMCRKFDVSPERISA